MTYDDIMERINKILAERMRIQEDTLFGWGWRQQQQAYRVSQAMRAKPSDYRPPDDGKTITLGKDDYRVVEEEEG